MSTQIRLEAEARYPVLTTTGRDEKAWAKRILHRAERGDKDLTAIQVQFAKQAIGANHEPA